MNDMQLSAESWQGDGEVRSVVPSGQIVLECSGCGNTVTLAHRVDGTAYTIKTLLRSSIRPLRPLGPSA